LVLSFIFIFMADIASKNVMMEW